MTFEDIVYRILMTAMSVVFVAMCAFFVVVIVMALMSAGGIR